jgi:PBSX family phage terminase large subunit
LTPTVTRTVRLHRIQSEFRHSAALYRGFVGGRGSGKTWVGAYDLIRRAKRGRTYLVASPTAVLMGDTTYPTFKARCIDLGIWQKPRLTPYPTVELTTGATIRFRTAEDPERMRGPNLSGVWLDEASLMPEEAYTISIASLREEGEQGWLSATFTPKGPFHWTFDVFGKSRPDTALFRARTRENPFNPPGFEATLAKQYGPAFARQELGGEFVETEGAEWPAAWFPESHFFRSWPRPEDVTLRVIALDPSKGKGEGGDYSAFVVVCRDVNGLLWVEADLDNRRPTTQIVTDGIVLARRIELETGGTLDGFGCESDQFQELLADQFVKQSRAVGIQLPLYKQTTGNKPKEERIRRLTPYLSTGLFRWRDTPGTRLLVQQLMQFPVAEHDDGPDALEYAIRLAVHLFNARPRTPTRRK